MSYKKWVRGGQTHRRVRERERERESLKSWGVGVEKDWSHFTDFSYVFLPSPRNEKVPPVSDQMSRVEHGFCVALGFWLLEIAFPQTRALILSIFLLPQLATIYIYSQHTKSCTRGGKGRLLGHLRRSTQSFRTFSIGVLSPGESSMPDFLYL